MSERRLRFRLRRGNFEVELEGDFDYVRGKFEELLQSQPAIKVEIISSGNSMVN